MPFQSLRLERTRTLFEKVKGLIAKLQGEGSSKVTEKAYSVVETARGIEKSLLGVQSRKVSSEIDQVTARTTTRHREVSFRNLCDGDALVCAVPDSQSWTEALPCTCEECAHESVAAVAVGPLTFQCAPCVYISIVVRGLRMPPRSCLSVKLKRGFSAHDDVGACLRICQVMESTLLEDVTEARHTVFSWLVVEKWLLCVG